MAFISMPGSGEWMVILIIGLLIFGRRLPDVARGLGKSVSEFKKGMREFQDSANEVARDVNKVTGEATADVQNAIGTSDYGYQEPSTSADYNTGHYAPNDPPAGEVGSSVATEIPSATTSDAAPAGEQSMEETLFRQNQPDSQTESAQEAS